MVAFNMTGVGECDWRMTLEPHTVTINLEHENMTPSRYDCRIRNKLTRKFDSWRYMVNGFTSVALHAWHCSLDWINPAKSA